MAIGYGDVSLVNDILTFQSTQSDALQITGWELTFALIQPNHAQVELPVQIRAKLNLLGNKYNHKNRDKAADYSICLSHGVMSSIGSLRTPSEAHWTIANQMLSYEFSDFSKDLNLPLIISRLLFVNDYGASLNRALELLRPYVSDEQVDLALGAALVEMTKQGRRTSVSLLLDKWRTLCVPYGAKAILAALQIENAELMFSTAKLIKDNCRVDLNAIIPTIINGIYLPNLVRLGADPALASPRTIEFSVKHMNLDRLFELYKCSLVEKRHLAFRLIWEVEKELGYSIYADERARTTEAACSYLTMAPAEVKQEILDIIPTANLDEDTKEMLARFCSN